MSNFSSCKRYLKQHGLSFRSTALSRRSRAGWGGHRAARPPPRCRGGLWRNRRTVPRKQKSSPPQMAVLNLVLSLGFRNTNTSYKTLFGNPSVRTEAHPSFGGLKRAIAMCWLWRHSFLNIIIYWIRFSFRNTSINASPIPIIFQIFKVQF